MSAITDQIKSKEQLEVELFECMMSRDREATALKIEEIAASYLKLADIVRSGDSNA